MTDPFDDAPVDDNENNEATEEQQGATTIDTPAFQQSNDDSRHCTAIIRGGGDYGAPNVSLRGADAHDLWEHYSDNRDSIRELMKALATDSVGFAKAVDQAKGKNANSGQSKGNGGNGKPDRQQAPNNQTPPDPCKHGDMEWKSWTRESDGKLFKGFFCTATNRSEQCKPDFR